MAPSPPIKGVFTVGHGCPGPAQNALGMQRSGVCNRLYLYLQRLSLFPVGTPILMMMRIPATAGRTLPYLDDGGSFG